MEEFQPTPLILCMENALGEEVSLQIEPHDDFQTFLEKAKLLLGFDVDINSITHNEPVSLTDNIYNYLMNSEYNQHGLPLDAPRNPQDDQLYILNDGTQICASQIHFDNDDPPIDLTAEKIPFVKYADDSLGDDEGDNIHQDVNTVKYNIVKSPTRWSKSGSPKNFIKSLPFKLVCNNTTTFEHQFTKYLESQNKTYATLNTVLNANKSPITLIKDNFKKFDDYKEVCYTREDILNMFKDSPVNSLPFEYTERKHVRKTDPSRIHKCLKPKMPYIDTNGVIIGGFENQPCYICGKNVDYTEKLYLFDNKDQQLHRIQKKMETQLKIICEGCLNENFKPCVMKNANQFLEPDQFLVIHNNQQYIFQKIKNFKINNDVPVSKKVTKENEFVKVEIGSDGEIVTKPIDNPNDNVIIVKDDKESSSDVEIIEELDTIIDNLDDADEEVKEFLGKYQDKKLPLEELKCRFCEKVFSDLTEVSEHCDVHKHNSDDGSVFPCPLCDYGYGKSTWLKAHVKTAHERVIKEESKPEEQKPMDTINEVKMEVKQEVVDISDDEIWIVRTADDEAEQQLQKLFVKDKESTSVDEKYPSCKNCNQVFPSAETLSAHKCRRAKKKKISKDNTALCMPTKEDFIKRPRKRRSNGDSMESQIVTCHNCNESFTSKVRLKFHMQFHEDSALLTPEGNYKCHLCEQLFDCETTLFDHVHFQHHKRHRWMCPVEGCGKTFYLRATLTKHSRTHTDTRRYVCVTCGKRFLDKQTLDEHGVTHLQIKPFQCHVCFKQLTRRSRLRMHLRAHEEEIALRLVCVCAVCSRAFRDAKDAQDHATKSPECIEAFANELKEESEEISVQLSPTSGLVREAVKREDSPKLSKPIKQQVCSDAAKTLLSELADEARGIIRVVEIEKAFRCEFCEDVFYLEEGLNIHRVIHKGIKNPFTCHICKVSFATYSRCTTHKTTHGFYKRPLQEGKKQNDGESSQSSTGILGYGDFPVVKHFLCEDCGRSYLHWTYLQVHRRMKHPNDNFQHKCNQCDMTFPNSWSVAYHRKKMHAKPISDEDGVITQKPKEDYRIPCRDCDKVLPNKTALYKHRKKEHSDMTLVEDCEADRQTAHLMESGYHRLWTSTAMRNHRLIYSGMRAWACEQCPKRFRIRSDLKTHLRLKHPSHLTVIEIATPNPTTENIINIVSQHNIPHDRIVEVTKINFSKGTTSVIPTSVRALSMLSDVPRTQVPFGRPPPKRISVGDWQPFRRGLGIAKSPHLVNTLQGDPGDATYPTTVNVTEEELSDLNIQLLLRDGFKSLDMRLIPCMKGHDEDEDHSKEIDREIKQWIKTYNSAIKLLLLGTGESGKTTIIKQMKILHVQGFSNSDRAEMVRYIRHNIHESIYDIVHNMTPLSIGLQNIKNIQSQQYILKLGAEGPREYTEDYIDHVRSLWRDGGVRECFRRSNEYQLIDSAEYFLDRIDLIEKSDYLPSDADILRCRRKTTGIQKIEFKVKVPKSMHGGVQDFWMFDVGGQRGERKKWIQVFEGIHAIWFLVACSDFDQNLREDGTQNRLKEALALFEDVWQSRFLLEAGLIVFLNKQDILESKISQGKSIRNYFPAFDSYEAPGDEYTRTKLFIRSLFAELTTKKRERKKLTASAERFVVLEASRPRECYFHYTTATDTDNIRTVFRDVHQMILTHVLTNIGVY
ncbi:hypothetical protein K1T71_014103 [Dendrolimus kikuchii]|uniref:Uncharacterized protein n=1 Tax=Dendrolimus kikuchii TaxID=765133 RepID=A0ACC1CEZ7_9NEOP|nr:hypothetical protein K1T71_014103 [Dendrolimus kikuchii]